MATKTRARTNTKDDYFALVKELPLTRIKTAKQHKVATSQLSRLVGRVEPPLSHGEEEYMDALATLVAAYEARRYHVDVLDVEPSDVIRHLVAENGLTVSGLAREIGVGQSNISEMLSGKREFSKAAIKGLCDRFGLNPSLFF
jgi:antitoxin component HigA of HigAB toxin-antitoxin module